MRNGEVRVRNGFGELVRDERVRRWGFVSVNFQRGFVRGVVEACLGPSESGERELVKILASGSEVDGVLRGPEEMGGELMADSEGKRRALGWLLGEWGMDGDEKGRVVYVGDSGTDLECLTKDGVVGIVMFGEGEDSEERLVGTLRRVGVRVQHVSEFGKHEMKGCEGEREGRAVFWARDFEEIARALL